MLFKALREDEITKGVSIERKASGLDLEVVEAQWRERVQEEVKVVWDTCCWWIELDDNWE